MKNTDQIKALAVAIEEKDNYIRMLLAQQGNNEVQIAEYRQIVRELSDKLELYEHKYGTVFRTTRSIPMDTDVRNGNQCPMARRT